MAMLGERQLHKLNTQKISNGLTLVIDNLLKTLLDSLSSFHLVTVRAVL